MPKENKLIRIQLKLKHRNPTVEIVMKKGTKKHDDKRRKLKHKKKEFIYDE